jgi:uncharacterized protein YecE (DUF72 family)
MPARILVGTASWSDPGFVKDWYPPGLRTSERLAFYAQRFEMVELNSSFYAIPDQRLVAQWNRVTPADFVFDVKLHKLLSRHSCELKMLPKEIQRIAKTTMKNRVILTPEIEAVVAGKLIEAIHPLEEARKLGVLLLQLSPSFSPRNNRLDELGSLLNQLSPRSIAVELRNRNWVEGDQLEQTTLFFRNHGVALVSVDAPKSKHFNVMPPIDVLTNPRVSYLRLHGRNEHGYISGKSVADRFDWDYSEDELGEIEQRVRNLAEQTEFVHVVFNNNRSNYAPKAALRFRRVLGQAVPMEEFIRRSHAEQSTLGI